MIAAALRSLRSHIGQLHAGIDRRSSATILGTSWCRALSSDDAIARESLEDIRYRIFGTRIGTGKRSGAKLLRRKLVGEKVASYYMDPIARLDPRYVSLRAEAKKAKLEKLKRRGKGPPPKGQGKRSSSGKRK